MELVIKGVGLDGLSYVQIILIHCLIKHEPGTALNVRAFPVKGDNFFALILLQSQTSCHLMPSIQV